VLSPILSAKPDCIYFGGMFDHTAVFYKQAREKAYKGLFLTSKFGNFPEPFCAQAYDAMAMVIKGIESAAAANNGKLPARAEVCKAVRALQNYPGITGTITFNGKGDLTMNKYFVLQVSSPDPAKWADNKIVHTVDIAPPQ